VRAIDRTSRRWVAGNDRSDQRGMHSQIARTTGHTIIGVEYRAIGLLSVSVEVGMVASRYTAVQSGISNSYAPRRRRHIVRAGTAGSGEPSRISRRGRLRAGGVEV